MTTYVRLFLIAGIALSSIPAQDFRATLSGQVTDASGGAVPIANIRAINTGTNEIKETRSSADGYYSIPYLNPGTYTVEVTASGFQTLRREGIILQVADKVNLPLALQIGQMTQEVTVVGQQEVMETTSADRGLVWPGPPTTS